MGTYTSVFARRGKSHRRSYTTDTTSITRSYIMIYDIEINETELKEFCTYYDLEYPTIIKQDEYSTQMDVDQSVDNDYLYFLKRDNIALWAEGELL